MTQAQLTRLLAELDPEGLTHSGAPDDEYAGEARRILERLPESTTVAELAYAMAYEFARSFNRFVPTDGDVAKFLPLAGLLLGEMKR